MQATPDLAATISRRIRPGTNAAELVRRCDGDTVKARALVQASGMGPVFWGCDYPSEAESYAKSVIDRLISHGSAETDSP